MTFRSKTCYPSVRHISVRPPHICPSVRHKSVRPYPPFILTPSNTYTHKEYSTVFEITIFFTSLFTVLVSNALYEITKTRSFLCCSLTAKRPTIPSIFLNMHVCKLDKYMYLLIVLRLEYLNVCWFSSVARFTPAIHYGIYTKRLQMHFQK